MKTFDIIVKDVTKLKDYGFIHNEKSLFSADDYRYYSKTRGTPQLIVDTNRRSVLLNSPSTVAIKVLCEMYKDGVIEFEDYRNKPKYQVSVTKEEYEMIMKMRKGE